MDTTTTLQIYQISQVITAEINDYHLKEQFCIYAESFRISNLS